MQSNSPSPILAARPASSMPGSASGFHVTEDLPYMKHSEGITVPPGRVSVLVGIEAAVVGIGAVVVRRGVGIVLMIIFMIER